MQWYFRYYAKWYLLLFWWSVFLKNLSDGVWAYFNFSLYWLKESFNYLPYQVLFVMFLIIIIIISFSKIIQYKRNSREVITDNNIKEINNDITGNKINSVYKFSIWILSFITLYLYSSVYVSVSWVHIPYYNTKFSSFPINLWKAIILRDYLSQDILLFTEIKQVTNIIQDSSMAITDWNNVYQDWMIISWIDSASFKIIDNSDYLKNSDYEKYISSNEYWLKEQYAYDKNHIYYNAYDDSSVHYNSGWKFKPLLLENYWDSIKILQEIQTKKRRIYYDEKNKKIFGVDGSSFRDTWDSNYVRDQYNVFFAELDLRTWRKKLQIVNCDINTFQAISINDANYLWSNYSMEFGKDKNSVYRNGIILTWIDSQKFSVDKDYKYIQDKNGKYDWSSLMLNKISEASPAPAHMKNIFRQKTAEERAIEASYL